MSPSRGKHDKRGKKDIKSLTGQNGTANDIRSQLGEAVLDRLIDSRAADSKAAYAAALEGADDLGERVARLAEAGLAKGTWRSAGRNEIVMSWWTTTVPSVSPQGPVRLLPGRTRHVLGPNVRVERTEHIVQGDRRCAYRVSPQHASHEKPRGRRPPRRKRQ